MKKMKSIFFIILCFLCLCTSADASDGISVLVNGSEVLFDVPPQIINGRTLVPLRNIFESLGAKVEYSPDTKKIQASTDDKTIEMFIDIPVMIVNGNTIALDVSPRIIDGRTLVPARAIADSLGASVQWNQASQSVIIELQRQTLYSLDGRTITVNSADVPEYKKVGWFESQAATQLTLYASDGRTITVFKAEVPAYKNVGWYESYSEATSAKTYSSTSSSSSQSEGKVYVGQTGTKYHYSWCPTLKGKGIAISYSEAMRQGRAACKVCH